MTESYWKDYKRQIQLDPMHSDDAFWKRVQGDIKGRAKPKHHLELYSYCRSDNPYIRQIKNSPNITTNTVAEVICRDKSCELMYCMMLQQKQAENRRSKIDIKGCEDQQMKMNSCLNEEKVRISYKEQQLKDEIRQLEEQKPIEMIQSQDIKEIYEKVHPQQKNKVHMEADI